MRLLERSEPCRVRLQCFEGPLDLLLHLIEKQQLDIHDIPVALVTEQYLEYVRAMKQLNIDVASEFLVMAAQLVQLKAQMLLPQRAEDVPPEDSAGEGAGDPREELVRQLIEYQRYKAAAMELAALHHLQARKYSRPAEIQRGPSAVDLAEVSVHDLMGAYLELMRQRGATGIWVIPRDEVSLRQKMREVLWKLRAFGPELAFADFFEGGSRALEVAVTFVAILELLRIGRIGARQEGNFGDIWVYLKKSHPGGVASGSG